MPLYTCALCNFSSKLKSNHKRHLNTAKHKRNLEQSLPIEKKSQKEPKRARKEPKRASKRARRF